MRSCRDRKKSSSRPDFELELKTPAFPRGTSRYLLSPWLSCLPMLPTCGFMTSVSETQRHDLLETPTVTSLRHPHPLPPPQRPGIPDRLGMGLDTRGDSGGALGQRKEQRHYRGGQWRAVHRSSQGRGPTQIPYSFLCQHSSPGTLAPRQHRNLEPKAISANSL